MRTRAGNNKKLLILDFTYKNVEGFKAKVSHLVETYSSYLNPRKITHNKKHFNLKKVVCVCLGLFSAFMFMKVEAKTKNLWIKDF